MRDIATVKVGEPVTVRCGFTPICSGTFAGFADGYIIIDHDDAYPTRIEVDSDVFDVWDGSGGILVRVEPHLALRGDAPERE